VTAEPVKTRPTGTTAAIAAMVVVIVSKAGLDLTAEEAAVIVGGLAAIVSIFTPRTQ
jgi:hypothetical protein